MKFVIGVIAMNLYARFMITFNFAYIMYILNWSGYEEE